MKRNNDVVKEDNMLISERYSESTDDTGKDIQQLGGTVELMVFMNKGEETLVHWLSDHFSSWHEFSIQFMKDVLKIISLNRFFWVEELQEFLNELRSDVHLKRSDFNSLIDNKL